MRPNANIIKTYWQAMDVSGTVYVYDTKPELNTPGNYFTTGNASRNFLFPIPLKPLQIAEITVNENGTWSYEIEREEGWYMAVGLTNGMRYILQYKNKCWFYANDGGATNGNFTISSTRIPDECII